MQSRRPDALVIVALALAGLIATLFSPPGLVRTVVGFPLVFLLPGYTVGGVVFPAGTLRLAERLLVTLSLSLVVSVVGGFVLNSTSAGLQPTSWAVLLSLVTLGALVVDMQKGPGSVAAGELRAVVPLLRPHRSQILLAIAGALTVAAFMVSTAGAQAQDRRHTFTQLWAQPTGDSGRFVHLGVKNMEQTSLEYRLDVTANGRPVGQQVSIYLKPGQQWEATKSLPAQPSSGDRVVVLLYREDRPALIYRRVELSRGA